MSQTYTVKGINLKAVPLGETDRLLTILTPEAGIIRAIAPGARKHNSRLAGRSSLFVINELLVSSGKSLDRIVQADTLYSFPGLSKDLGKLTAGQYLAEIVLYQAVSHQSQDSLFRLLQEHLERIEATEPDQVLARLVQATFHLLALAGLAPQVYRCCRTQIDIQPPLVNPRWRIGFSAAFGGLLFPGEEHRKTLVRLNSLEVAVLQRLAEAELPDLGNLLEKATLFPQCPPTPPIESDTPLSYPPPWLALERALRGYVEYHFDRTIRSATLIDSYFSSQTPAVSFP